MNLKWFDIYSELTEALNAFYVKHKEKSGEEFFKKCAETPEFVKLFKFVKNLDERSIRSIDPIHIYASFNYYNISASVRKEKLSFYYNVLGLNTSSLQHVDLNIFPFFPHPMIVNIVGSRDQETQQNVWKFFHAISTKNEHDIAFFFEQGLESWWGLNIPSLTTFMFWAYSDRYLPLDTNTESLLLEHHIITHLPKSYQEYMQVNDRGNGLSNNIYRNIAHYSYKEKSSVSLSSNDLDEINSFLNGTITPIKLEEYESNFSKQIEQSKKDDPAKRKARLRSAEPYPSKINVQTTVFKRNPDVVAEVLLKANGICEACKQKAPFRRKDGSPYLEIHHIRPLAKGGKDTVDNAQALCPNCHRKAHFGI